MFFILPRRPQCSQLCAVAGGDRDVYDDGAPGPSPATSPREVCPVAAHRPEELLQVHFVSR